MKAFFLAFALFALIVLDASNVRAQVYGSYYDSYPDVHYQQYWQYQYYLQWQQYLEYSRLNDPYYDLHFMHYQLYLQPYPAYRTYPPCCSTLGIPWSSSSLERVPHLPRNRLPQAVRRR